MSIFVNVIILIFFGIYSFFLLTLRRNKNFMDVIFLSYLFQLIVYVFLAPSINAMNRTEDIGIIYSVIQIIILIFYVGPLLFTYYSLRVRHEKLFPVFYNSSLSRMSLTSNNWLLSLFLTFCLILALSFVSIALNYGLLFRRIGHEALYEASASVPFFYYIIYKFFTDLSLFVIFLLIIISYQVRSFFLRIITKVVLVFYSVIYGGFTIMNNRLQLILIFICLFILLKILLNKRAIFSRWTILMLLLLMYLSKVVVNVRNNYVDNAGEISFMEVINPLYHTSDDINDPLENRLDGVELISVYYPKLLEKGFLYLRPWSHSLRMIFGQVVGSDYYNLNKKNLTTNVRSFIIKSYFDEVLTDFNQCQLTEVFAILGPLSLCLTGIFTGFWLFKITSLLYFSKGSFLILISLLALPFALEFEKDYMNMLFGWLKYIPIVLIIYKIRLFKPII